MTSNFASKALKFAAAATVAIVAISAPTAAANAARLKVSILNFDFNTAGNLSNDFTTYIDSGTPGTITQSANGGINDSGAISATDDGSATNAVVEPNANYSMGPVGAQYVFSGFMKSTGGSGYSGFGFTTLEANAQNVGTTSGSSGVFKPADALGISVHGGGFIFHNGATDYEGGWDQGSDSNGIHAVKAYTDGGDLIGDPASNSSLWYKVVYSIKKTSSTQFTGRVEVYFANADGTLVSPTAKAIFEVPGMVNSTVNNSTELASYINFSGFRVTKFDSFSTKVIGANITGAPSGSVTEESTTPLANTGGNGESLMLLSAVALFTAFLGFVLMNLGRKKTEN